MLEIAKIWPDISSYCLYDYLDDRKKYTTCISYFLTEREQQQHEYASDIITAII